MTEVVRLGSDARIPCPMSGHPAPMIDWAKGGESISPYSWERFRTSKKSLKIANVHKEDSGEYTCKGTNGFGSEEVTINLVVIGKRVIFMESHLPLARRLGLENATNSDKYSQTRQMRDIACHHIGHSRKRNTNLLHIASESRVAACCCDIRYSSWQSNLFSSLVNCTGQTYCVKRR